MEKFDSITHFIQSGNFDYRIFDMGRKVVAITADEFASIENQQSPYPCPFQQTASLALLFWPSKSGDKTQGKEPVIWFLQFPVDELGYLQQESRDGFLIGLLEQAGKNIQAKQQGDKALDELDESPFAFKPQPERLAMLHALATRELGQAPSHYYQATREYLKGTLGYEQWQFLGLQGIADVVARLDEEENEVLLVNALSELPEVPLENFALLLENSSPKKQLTQVLGNILGKQLESNKPNIKLTSALLRALSGAKPDKLRRGYFLTVLVSDLSTNIEVLVAISGRAWLDLHDEELLVPYIERLAKQNQMAFNAVVADLMMLPEMKQKVLDVMRRADRSDLLSQKLSEFMKVLQS
jgi:hypothetical protein